MSRAKKSPKPLSAAARKRVLAQQTLWAVVNRFTGAIADTGNSRSQARWLKGNYNRNSGRAKYCVERVNVRVVGVRA